MYEFQHYYVKPKSGKKVKFCYIDFTVYITTDDTYKDVAQDRLRKDIAVEKRFYTSNHELDHWLKEKKFLRLMKDVLVEFVELRAKFHS